MNIICLKNIETLYVGLNLESPLNPMVNILLPLLRWWQMDLTHDIVSHVVGLGIKHGEGERLINHSQVHQIRVLLPENGFVKVSLVDHI